MIGWCGCKLMDVREFRSNDDTVMKLHVSLAVILTNESGTGSVEAGNLFPPVRARATRRIYRLPTTKNALADVGDECVKELLREKVSDASVSANETVDSNSVPEPH